MNVDLERFSEDLRLKLGRTSDLQTTLTKILIDFEEPPHFDGLPFRHSSIPVSGGLWTLILCHITASRTTDSVVSRTVQQGIGLDVPPENFSVFAFFRSRIFFT